MPARLGLSLASLVALVVGACAQTPPEADAVAAGPVLFEVATPTTEGVPDAVLDAALEAQDTARRASSPLTAGASEAELAMRDGRMTDSGTDELRIARDSLDRVRSVSLTTFTEPTASLADTRSHLTYYFDGTGRAVGMGHLIQIGIPSTCRRPVASWFVDVLLDGTEVVAVRQRLPATNGPGETDCAPPRPAGLTVPMYATARDLLSATGVTDLDALEWTAGTVRPPLRPPPPPGPPPPPPRPRRN